MVKGLIKYKPHPKQILFHKDRHPYKWFCSGIRSGKSTAAVVEALRLAMEHPGCIGIMAAPSFRLLDQTLLRSWEEMLPRSTGAWTYNAHKREMRLPWLKDADGNETLIYWRSTSNPDEISGITAAWFIYDEVGVAPSIKGFEELSRRLSKPAPGKQCQGVLTGTPAGSNHWTARLFGTGHNVPGFTGSEDYWWDEEHNQYAVIRAKTWDNPIYPKDGWYVKRLLNRPDATPEWVEQYLEAKFTSKRGQIFPFDVNRHVVSVVPSRNELVRTYVGVDFGSGAPGGMLVIGEDRQRKLWVLHEEYHRHKLWDMCSDGSGWFNLADTIKKVYRPQWFVADSASPDTIRRLRLALRNNPVVWESNKDTLGSIRRLQKLLYTDRLFVHNSCVNFIREMSNWEWKIHPKFDLPLDEPADGEDHLIDCARYAVMLIDNI